MQAKFLTPLIVALILAPAGAGFAADQAEPAAVAAAPAVTLTAPVAAANPRFVAVTVYVTLAARGAGTPSIA